MTDENRTNFEHALDVFARMFRITPLDAEAKLGYFKALKGQSIENFLNGLNTLCQTYKPRRKDDFPPPAVILEAITGVSEAHASRAEPVSRTYPEIVASYKRRWILIGEEARERLEIEQDRRRQEIDESA